MQLQFLLYCTIDYIGYNNNEKNIGLFEDPSRMI